MVLWHLKQSEKVKKLNKWVPCAAAAKSLQLCPTLYNSIHCSPPGSPVPGILQARILEWVAISFSNARKWKVKVKLLSRVRLLATPRTPAYKVPPSMGFSRQEYWSGLPLLSPTLWADRKQQQKITLWSVISYSKQQQWIVMCNKKVDFVKQLVKPAQWVDQEVPKEFPKPTLCEERSWSLFGGLLPVWSSTAFWTPVKPIHLRSILGKLMRCTQNCNACSQDWSTERTQFFSLTTPVNAAQPKLQKLNKLGYEVLPRLPYSPDLSPANYHLFKHLDNFL